MSVWVPANIMVKDNISHVQCEKSGNYCYAWIQHTIDQLAIWDWQFVCLRWINRQGIYLVFIVNKLSVHLHLICQSLRQHIFKMKWQTNQPRTTFARAGLQANWPAVKKFCPPAFFAKTCQTLSPRFKAKWISPFPCKWLHNDFV